MVLPDVPRALQHGLLVTTSFTHVEANLGWREHFSVAVSPRLSLHASANLRPGAWAADAFASSDTACPTSSLGHPHAGGPLSLPADGLYGHSGGLSTYVNKNYFIRWCLHKAFINFVSSLCFLHAIFSQRRRLYPTGSHAVALSYYILFSSFLHSSLPYKAFRTISIPLCRLFLFLP